jgi:hypothetical protein
MIGAFGAPYFMIVTMVGFDCPEIAQGPLAARPGMITVVRGGRNVAGRGAGACHGDLQPR